MNNQQSELSAAATEQLSRGVQMALST